ncbi:hypothetical protein T492DRAFT_874892 [Pavlovales sp. CCMP2436]|nr:hypothetical protein T492DRAFT_874892 [Pavlovales sp. CCMP2436]
MNRHKRACGTAQTQVCKGRTEQQNRVSDVNEGPRRRFLVTHEEALGHIQHLPRGAGVAIAQVQSCSPDAATRTFTVKFEQVIVLRNPLTYAHTREGLRWSVVPAVFRQLTAQTNESTLMRSDTETTVAIAIYIGRI